MFSTGFAHRIPANALFDNRIIRAGCRSSARRRMRTASPQLRFPPLAFFAWPSHRNRFLSDTKRGAGAFDRHRASISEAGSYQGTGRRAAGGSLCLMFICGPSTARRFLHMVTLPFRHLRPGNSVRPLRHASVARYPWRMRSRIGQPRAPLLQPPSGCGGTARTHCSHAPWLGLSRPRQRPLSTRQAPSPSPNHRFMTRTSNEGARQV
jgi:hypothetical protein